MTQKIKKSLCAALACLFFISPLSACASIQNPPIDGALPPQTDAPTQPEQPETDGDAGENEPPQMQQPPQQQPPQQQPQKKWARYIRVTGRGVNIRAQANTTSAVVGQAEQGTTYAVTGQAGGFYKTVYKHQTVYISAAYVYEFSLEKSQNEQVEQVIEQGYSLIGVPYVYGAVRLHDGYGNKLSSFNKNKFDCSSLTQFMFYYGAGVLLGTTTRTQVKQGSFVQKSELSRGDCIYYTNETRFHLSGTERIGHVAVYLGDGFILHTASDFARIEKMSSTRWSYYIEARRFL